MPIELRGARIDCVYNYRCRGDLGRLHFGTYGMLPYLSNEIADLLLPPD